MELGTLLHGVVPGKVLFIDEGHYGAFNDACLTIPDTNWNPLFVVQPANATDVSGIVMALSPLVKERSVSIAIHGTNRTPFSDGDNGEGRVTIDLSGLKGITINEDKSSVNIGVGETRASVYDELQKHHLTTPDGYVGRLGIDGPANEGIPFYSASMDFALDSVIEFEVVLSSGEIVRANNDKNRDLWITLRGGFNNFSIVTSFRMNIFESSNIWGGVAHHRPDTFDQFAEATLNFVNESDENARMMYSAGYAYGHRTVTCCFYHFKGLENPPSLQPFTSLPGRIDQKECLGTPKTLLVDKKLALYALGGVRSFQATFSITPDVFLIKAIHNEWAELIESLKDVDGFASSLAFSPMTKAMFAKSQRSRTTPDDTDPKEGPLLIIMFKPFWNLTTDDGWIHEGIKMLLAKSRSIAEERGLVHRDIFTNDVYGKKHHVQRHGQNTLAIFQPTSQGY